MDQVTKKSIWGFIRLFIVVCLILFLSAWTVNYWQAWVFLAAFFIPVILLIKHDKQLLERRLSGGPKAEKQHRQKTIQGFASIFSIGLILLPGFDHRFHWSHVPVFLVLTSNAVIMLAFLIIHYVFKGNSFASAIIEVDKDQSVISTELYGIVRHPMYSGAIILFVFTPFALGSFWALPFVLPLLIVIMARLMDEEKYLKKNLNGYEEYCRKVRYRLIPFIW